MLDEQVLGRHPNVLPFRNKTKIYGKNRERERRKNTSHNFKRLKSKIKKGRTIVPPSVTVLAASFEENQLGYKKKEKGKKKENW